MQVSVPGLLMEDSRVRPLWLVIMLSVLTLGTYSVLWSGLVWSDLELLRRRPPQLHPAVHALGMVVPVYGAIRAYRYFSLVATVGRSHDLRVGAPLPPTIALAAANLLALVAIVTDGGIRTVLWATAVTLITVTIAISQSALNRLWYAAIGRYAEDRVTSAEWVMLVIGFILLPLLLMGALITR